MFGIAPPNTDYFMNTLGMILGPIVHHVTGIGGKDGAADTATAVSVLLGYVNTIALFIAVAWILYVGFVGLLKTAHEGEWLGQKWSMLWIPLRIAIAAALVLPVFPSAGGGNYSAVQSIVVWAEGNAVGMADKAWNLAGKYIVTNPIGGVEMNPSKVNSMASGILTNEVCMDAVNRGIDTNPAIANLTGQNPIALETAQTTTTTASADAVAFVWNLGANTLDNIGDGGTLGSGHPVAEIYDEDEWAYNTGSPVANYLKNFLPIPNVCGSIMYPASASNLGTGNAIGSSVQANVDNAIWHISSAQMQTLVSGEQAIANNIADRTGAPSRKDYGTLIHTYEQTVMKDAIPAIAAAEKPATQKFISSMNEQGFATAGSWWWQLMHMNAMAQNAINNIGTMTMPGSALMLGDIGLLHRVMAAPMGRTATFLKAYQTEHNPGVKGSPASKMPQASDASVAGVLDGIFQGAVGNWSSDLAEDRRNENPLLGVENIGTILESAGASILADEGAGDLLSGIASGANSIPLVGTATKAASSAVSKVVNGPVGMLLMAIAAMCFGLGLVMSVWIPMLPYIIWTFAIFGLLIFFVEAVFAAPFWAISHMNPEGHEVVGSGGKGWMLMLQLVLKPMLMVGGLVAGTAMLYAGAWILQHTIGGAILDTFSNSIGGFVGPFDGLAQVIIYCFMLIVFIDMSFGLIHKLPDLVMGWIGGGSTDRGEGDMQAKEKGGRDKGGNFAQGVIDRKK